MVQLGANDRAEKTSTKVGQLALPVAWYEQALNTDVDYGEIGSATHRVKAVRSLPAAEGPRCWRPGSGMTSA